jgi:hypothetical protein
VAIQLKVRNNKQIIVPVRFARAVTGGTVTDAPDVDDRGFVMGTRPSSWGSTDARGAMCSIAQGDTVRFKVVRADIEDSAPLFVVSTNTSVLTIAGSAGPLVDGVFSVRATADEVRDPVKIQVCLGSETGPVLGEMEPHIFQMHQVRVRAHLMTVSGVATVRTAASLVPLFRDVNKIWRNVGIQFLYDQTQALSDSFHAASPGKVNDPDFNPLIQVNIDPNAVNIYFIPTSDDFTGGTLDHDHPRPDGFGIAVVDIANANDLAHELGHYLDSDIHAGENASSHHFRDDVWVERRLIYEFGPLDSAQATYRHNVTYGNLVRGAMISVKNFALDPSDGEVDRNRRRSLNPN